MQIYIYIYSKHSLSFAYINQSTFHPNLSRTTTIYLNMSNGTKETPLITSPSRLAHVVLRTGNLKEMSPFYKTFLGGKAQVESDQVAFITYDDEHHRIALVSRPDLQKLPPKSCGLDVRITAPN